MSYPFVRDIHYFRGNFEAKYESDMPEDSTHFGYYTIKCFSTTEEPDLEPRRLLVFFNGDLLDPHRDYEVGPRASKYGSLGSKEVRIKRVIRGPYVYPVQDDRVDLIYYPMVEEEMEYAFEIVEEEEMDLTKLVGDPDSDVKYKIVDQKSKPATKSTTKLCRLKRLSDEDYDQYNHPYGADEADDRSASWYGPENIKNEKLMVKAKRPTKKRKYTGKHNTNYPHFIDETPHNEDIDRIELVDFS